MTFTGERETHDGPMTLHSIMQESVGMELRERYKPERAIPHGMLVLLMQINEDKARARRAQHQAAQESGAR